MSFQVHNTRFIGHRLIKFSEINSTNALAKELIAKNEPLHGAVILADFQTKGRGQASNIWDSAPNKNLLMTLVLQPKNVQIQEQFFLNMAVSVAIVDCVQRFVKEKVEIKWPNDILIAEKKTCGILIENFIKQQNISHFIVGLGLNVNQTHFHESIQHVTSLKLATGYDVEINEVLNQLCLSFENYLELFNQKKFGAIKRLYFSKLFRYQEKHNYLLNGKTVQGEIIGVSDYGLLQISINNQLQSFANKEIQFVY